MSYLSDSRQPKGPGILILRHKGHVKQGIPVDARAGMLGVEITGRTGLLGQYDYENDGVGDINHALLWPADIQKRAVGAWSWAFPAISAPSQSSSGARTLNAHPNAGPGGISFTGFSDSPVIPGGGTTATGRCRIARMDEESGASSGVVRPIFVNENDEPVPDDRFKPMRPIVCSAGGGKQPKSPMGQTGIVLASTNEDRQRELFFPLGGGGGQLLAVNEGGDWEMGTVVADTTPDWEVDAAKTARLQSMMWVVSPVSVFSDKPFIAWNIGTSGCADHQGGAVIQSNQPGCGMLDASVAFVNASFGGPFHVGGGIGDKHFLGSAGANAGERPHPCNPLHLAANTFWIGSNGDSAEEDKKSDEKGGEESEDVDGPFDFEGRLPPDTDIRTGQYSTPVHLEYWIEDPTKGADGTHSTDPASNPMMGTEEMTEDGKRIIYHQSPAGRRKGRWKWRAEATHEPDEDEDGGPPPEQYGPEGGGPPVSPPSEEELKKAEERVRTAEEAEKKAAAINAENPPVPPNEAPAPVGGNNSGGGSDNPTNPPGAESIAETIANSFRAASTPPKAGDQQTGKSAEPKKKTVKDWQGEIKQQQEDDRQKFVRMQNEMALQAGERAKKFSRQQAEMERSAEGGVPPKLRQAVDGSAPSVTVDPATGNVVVVMGKIRATTDRSSAIKAGLMPY